MKKLILLSLVLFQIASVSAYDFSTQVGNNTLYFTILNTNLDHLVYIVAPNGNNWNGYTKPTGNLIIPSTVSNGGVTYSVCDIGDDAFYVCSGLTSITIPNSVTMIGSFAFYGCSGLTSVTIPNSVKVIHKFAFEGCSGLTSVTIPNSVTDIYSHVFRNCSGLTTVYWNNDTASIEGGGDDMFDGCSNLTNFIFGNQVRYIPAGICSDMSYLTSVTIPNSVTSIGIYAFSNCSSLTSVTIPNSVTEICTSAFEGCSGLTSVTIGNSVTTIGVQAFYYCSSLSSITIPNSVTMISSHAFEGCSGLTSVTIGNSVTTIGVQAFYGCSSLSSITIPNSVTYMGNAVFKFCTGLTSITIPNSVTSIGRQAFADCSNLTKTNYTGSIAEWCNIDFADSSANPVCYSKNLYINNQLITDLKIPNGVDTIKNYTFAQATCLTSVTIPSSVTSIGGRAFYGCSGLDTITFEGATPPVIGSEAFSGVPANVAVYIPCGTLALFAARMPNINNFIESQISFSAVSEDNNKGTVQILNTPTCTNPNAVINAVAAANYRFDHWSDGNTDNPRSLYVTGDTSLIAYFERLDVGVQEIKDANVKVYVSGNSILIEDAYAQGYENEMVTVYDVLGREIAKARLEGNNLRLPVQPSGIYIVKINGLQPYKVVVP